MTENQNPSRNYGIRVSLPDGDPFTALLDDDWSAEHWFEKRTERDLRMHDMQREHEYSRNGDAPALIFTPIDRSKD